MSVRIPASEGAEDWPVTTLDWGHSVKAFMRTLPDLPARAGYPAWDPEQEPGPHEPDNDGLPVLSPAAERQRDALVRAHRLLPARGGRTRCSRCEVSFSIEELMQASTICRHGG